MHGFDIVDSNANILPASYKNHLSAMQNPDIVLKHIETEIEKGNYVICNEDIQHPAIVSPLGLVPKSDGGHRLIHDCSLPKGKCLNNYAVYLDKCKYESVDSAVAMLKPGYFMAKVEIKAAYRSVAISPKSYPATGL